MPLLVEAKELAQHPKLTGAYLSLAVQLQEAAADMTASHVGRTLSDAVQAAHKGTGKWASYLDHSGDDTSGDVIYSCSGDTMSCPYEMQSNGDGVASTAKLDMDNARKVSPVVSYEDVPDDDSDGMETMYEASVYTRGGVPLVERFVSKAERDKMDEGDFAGKGKSFPINKPADVMAALQSIGRAGPGNYGPAKLRANIIAIAKKKGFPLPKSAQSDDAKEAAKTVSGGLRLVESATTLENIVLREARADYEIKLIAPGAGSSAFYPKEVLQRDGPNVFKSGTHVYLNHQTAAEEAARPEGDVLNLAGVLTTDAAYHESHAKGPGLYARMKVFADHAQTVEEKAAHVGMSIRASGIAESGKSRGGLPVLKELTAAQSVDVVTHAGAGGMILTEAARAANSNQEASMDAEELKLLRESVARLSGKETRREAIQEGARILRDVSLPDAAKEYVIETVLKEALPMKDGALDITKFTESVNAEARRFGAAIGAGPRVTGMGAAPVVEITEAQRAQMAANQKAEDEMYKESWSTLLDGNAKLAEVAVRGRAN
jgi:hypothetical protein